MSNNTPAVSRKQLIAYGATDYLACALTKALTPVGKQGNSFLYLVSDVIASIDCYLQGRIRKKTKELLPSVRLQLVKLDIGIDSDDTLEKIASEILEEHIKFKQAIAESKQREEKFYATHGSWIKRNLVKHNNIVSFKGNYE